MERLVVQAMIENGADVAFRARSAAVSGIGIACLQDGRKL